MFERANDLIVDCVSMSECFAKLPTRVEHRSRGVGRAQEGVSGEVGWGWEAGGLLGVKKKAITTLLTSR